MKTRIVAAVAAMLLCGCGQRDAYVDSKIANLESRMAALEAYSTNLETAVRTTLTNSAADLAQMLALVEDFKSNQVSSTEAIVSALMFTATNQPPPPKQTRAQYVPVQMRDGVPLSIYNSIAAEAVRKWPNDYEMQRYTITKQVEAYKALHQ